MNINDDYEWYQSMWVNDDDYRHLIDYENTDPSRGETERADSTGLPRPAWNPSGQQDT